MPIDSGIPLEALGGLQRAQPFNPMATLGDLAQLQNYRAQMEYRQAQAQKEQYEFQKQQQIDALAQQHGDDPDAFISAVGRVDPFLASKYAEQLGKARTEGAKAKSEEVKQSLAYLEAGTQLIQGATPESYGARRSMVLKLSPDLAPLLPEQYDETAISGLLQVGQSTKDFLAAQQKGIEQFLNGKPQEALGTMFANAQTPQQWAIVQDLAVKAGQKALLPYFGDFSPENMAKARSLALGPKEEAAIADRAVDNARQAAADAETARSHRATEAISAGQLGVARGNLAVAQGNLAVRKEEASAKKAGVGPDGKPAMTPSMKAGIGRIKGLLTTLDKLDNTLTQQTGIAGKAAGMLQRGIATTGLDENATVYEGLSNALLPALARASGEVGNLAEKEQERYGLLAPKVSDPLNVRRKKLKAMKALVDMAESGGTADEMTTILDRAFGPDVSAEAPAKANPFRKK